MAYHVPTVQKVMVPPINLIFRFLQSRTRVRFCINQFVNKRFEGIIIGFDEYMNLVLDDAVEINVRSKRSRKLGKILLRGDNVLLIHKENQEECPGLGEEESVATGAASTSQVK